MLEYAQIAIKLWCRVYEIISIEKKSRFDNILSFLQNGCFFYCLILLLQLALFHFYFPFFLYLFHSRPVLICYEMRFGAFHAVSLLFTAGMYYNSILMYTSKRIHAQCAALTNLPNGIYQNDQQKMLPANAIV